MENEARRTTDALEIIDRMIGDDAELRAMIDEEMVSLEVAQLVYDARQAAGLTQKELARRVGTTQSVIARLEDADYRGHSLTMLQRIAKALDLQLSVQFLPPPRARRQRKAAAAT